MLNIKTASLAISLAALASAANAQAIIQYSDSQGYGYRTEPLYPYAPPQRGLMRTEKPRVETHASPVAQPTRKVDPALIEELRNKRKAIAKPNTKPKASVDVTASIDHAPDNKKFTRTVVVREKPIVRTNYRVVEHPPIVVQREVSEDQVEGGGHAQVAPLAVPQAAPQGAPFAARTIRAEAEITILGPDRMSIRLYRKQDGGDANAKVAKPPTKRSAGADSKTKIR
jgi:hypothetical protein